MQIRIIMLVPQIHNDGIGAYLNVSIVHNSFIIQFVIYQFGLNQQNFEKPMCKQVLFKNSMCSSFKLDNKSLPYLCCLTSSILTEINFFLHGHT